MSSPTSAAGYAQLPPTPRLLDPRGRRACHPTCNLRCNPVQSTLQPCAIHAATNPVQSTLQPTLCNPRCNPVPSTLQPCAIHAATLCLPGLGAALLRSLPTGTPRIQRGRGHRRLQLRCQEEPENHHGLARGARRWAAHGHHLLPIPTTLTLTPTPDPNPKPKLKPKPKTKPKPKPKP